ncbi:MAG: VOC family protein [Hyphomicrobiales bacterium]
MEQRLSLVTLGVSDLGASRRFYERLGWTASAASQGDIVFFQMNGFALALYPRDALAADAQVENTASGFPGVTMAHNLGSEAEVDRVFAAMVEAGARPLKPPRKAFWGGYSSYVADPDGHLWEIAHDPFLPLDRAGDLRLPDSRK